MKSLFTSILILATASLANAAAAEATLVPVTDFQVPDDLEVTVWATSPMLFNPTNMDTDAQGRIWVAEGVNYRKTRSLPLGAMLNGSVVGLSSLLRAPAGMPDGVRRTLAGYSHHCRRLRHRILPLNAVCGCLL